MRQGILIFVQRVFDLPVVGAFKLLHVMLWITALAFLGGPASRGRAQHMACRRN